uniref:hypothetical protein n=1 Tax=Megasphaera micronuciformis TaxID=187326 RepID=UPI0040280469
MMKIPVINDEKQAKLVRITLIAILMAFCLGCIYFAVQHEKKPVESPVQMRFSDTTDKNAVKKNLHVDDKTAGELVTRIERIHEGTVSPNVTYYVSAPDLQTAADTTEMSIRNKDPRLPKEAVANSDCTVVTVDDTKQKVDVYKINLRNNHKIKAGGTYIDGKPYLSIGYQAGRMEGIAHIGQDGRQGGTLLYTIKEW